MKAKFFTLSFIFALLFGSLEIIQAQGLEDFTNFPVSTSTSYVDGTFVGNDGSTWSYWQCRRDIHITPPTPTLGKNRTPTSSVESGTISGGIGVLNFDYMQAFSTNVNLDVFVNGVLVTTVTSNGEQNLVKNSGDIVVNVPGDFVLKFIQHDANAGQVSIDNISWTGYTSSALPEPTNYPTNFAAQSGPFSVTLTWQDATTGAQVPQAYLIKASTQNNITAPQDGTFEPDDLDFSDGKGAKNVVQGIQTFTFEGLDNNKTYYFKIFPYTNTGSMVNYKTDGNPPSAQATTPNLTLIHSIDFDDRTFGQWTTFSVLGDQVWLIDTIHGVNNTPCAKISGYSGGSKPNEDWLISPKLNLGSYTGEILQFYTARNYAGPDLVALVSTNYNGGDPTTAYWEPLEPILSSGGWSWTFSGNIDISAFAQGDLTIAFKYTSTDTESATWEVDNVKIYGQSTTGIKPVAELKNRIYPNPASNTVQILLASQAKVSIVSLTGDRILESTFPQGINTINIHHLNSGVYLVKIETLATTETHRLIIK
ncbi:MAG: choice-of-anchor J domain-containing protein [Bacteroidales bacterium]